jgi:hypothetical protein
MERTCDATVLFPLTHARLRRILAGMNYVLFAISAYIFMRAFEVFCADRKDRAWYRATIKVVAAAVLYCAMAAIVVFYHDGVHLLGFDPK